MLARIARPALRQVFAWNEAACTQVRHYHPPANYKQPTMDDLPIPQGSWKAAYDAQQKKNNLHLISGIVVFAVTLGVVAKTDIIDFNFFPPELPSEES